MSEYNHDDFSEPIQDMAADAIHRMFAIQEGYLTPMQSRDVYRSEIVSRGQHPRRVTHDAVLYAEVVDHIEDRMVIEPQPADYLNALLAQLVIKLEEYAYYRRKDGSSRLEPSFDAAKSAILERWLLSGTERLERSRFSLFTTDLGSIGITKLVMDYDDSASVWHLGFEGRFRRVSMLPDPIDPDNPEVTIVED
ncbi:MAG: hypothetical protein V4678_01735 [Patescibacteria group bacterium]